MNQTMQPWVARASDAKDSGCIAREEESVGAEEGIELRGMSMIFKVQRHPGTHLHQFVLLCQSIADNCIGSGDHQEEGKFVSGSNE
jgi:hypothetical protein